MEHSSPQLWNERPTSYGTVVIQDCGTVVPVVKEFSNKCSFKSHEYTEQPTDNGQD
ncbi:MAG: hypothetical protein ACI3YQ_09805 [Prevotella sp.]